MVLARRGLAVLALLALSLPALPAASYLSTQPPPPGPVEAWSVPALGLVEAAAWSPDGALIALAGFDVTVLRPDGSVAWRARAFNWTESPASTVAWSPDGRLLAVASPSGSIAVYTRDGSLAWRASLGHYLAGIAWEPHGLLLAAWGYGGLRVYDASTGSTVFDVDGVQVASAAWSPDGGLLAVTIPPMPQAGVAVYRSDGGLAWRASAAGEAGAPVIAWSPDGGLLAVGDSAGVRVYTATGTLSWREDTGEVTGLQWTREGRLLISTATGIAALYTASGRLLWLRALGGAAVHAWYNGESGRILAVVGGVAYCLRASDGADEWSLRVPRGAVASWAPGGSAALIWSWHGRLVEAVALDGSIVWARRDLGSVYQALWSPGEPVALVLASAGVALIGRDGSVAWSTLALPPEYLDLAPGGGLLAAIVDGQVVVYGEGGRVAYRPVQYGGALAAAWSPNGSLLAVLEENETAGALALHEETPEGFRVLRRLRLSPPSVYESTELPVMAARPLAWSPNGSLLACVDGDHVVVLRASRRPTLAGVTGEFSGSAVLLEWLGDDRILLVTTDAAYLYTARGEPVASRPGAGGHLAATSPDGSLLAVAVQDKVRVFSLPGLRLAWEAPTPSTPTALAWSPDGHRLAVALYDPDTGAGYVEAYDASSGRPIWRTGELGLTLGLQWTPAALYASYMNLADLEAGGLAAIDPESGSVTWEARLGASGPLALTPDGSLLAVASYTGIHAYTLTPTGVLVVQGPQGTVIHVEGPGGSGDYTLDNGTVTLYATPGDYKVDYETPTGSSGVLKATVEPGQTTTVTIPQAGRPTTTATAVEPGPTTPPATTTTTAAPHGTATTKPPSTKPAAGTTTTAQPTATTEHTTQPEAPATTPKAGAGNTALLAAAAAVAVAVAAALLLRRR